VPPTLALSISVATPWVFSQDLGFFDPTLGYGFFHEGLGFFLGFFKDLGIFWDFSHFTGKYIFSVVSGQK